MGRPDLNFWGGAHVIFLHTLGEILHVSFELNTGDLDQGKKIHYDFTFSITLKQLSLVNLMSNCNFRKKMGNM